jgi:hypothetical protein
MLWNNNIELMADTHNVNKFQNHYIELKEARSKEVYNL